jgi:hypothetical protein
MTGFAFIHSHAFQLCLLSKVGERAGRINDDSSRAMFSQKVAGNLAQPRSSTRSGRLLSRCTWRRRPRRRKCWAAPRRRLGDLSARRRLGDKLRRGRRSHEDDGARGEKLRRGRRCHEDDGAGGDRLRRGRRCYEDWRGSCSLRSARETSVGIFFSPQGNVVEKKNRNGPLKVKPGTILFVPDL